LVSVEKVYFNLPKEVLEEAIAYKYKVYFLPKKDSGKRLYYYECAHQGCSYRIKILENPDLIKTTLSTAALIANVKAFDLDVPSELSEGICHVTEYGEHQNDHYKNPDQNQEFDKEVKSFVTVV